MKTKTALCPEIHSISVQTLGPATFPGSKKHPSREEVIAVLRDLRKKTKHHRSPAVNQSIYGTICGHDYLSCIDIGVCNGMHTFYYVSILEDLSETYVHIKTVSAIR